MDICKSAFAAASSHQLAAGVLANAAKDLAMSKHRITAFGTTANPKRRDPNIAKQKHEPTLLNAPMK